MTVGLHHSSHPDQREFGAALRKFAAPRQTMEFCELCSAPLAAAHEHLVELATRQFVCACDPCAILFGYEEQARYRRVPRRIELLSDFRLSDTTWNSLGVPIGLAFLMHNSTAERTVAIYPSPAGAVESLLSLDSWEEIVADNPQFSPLAPDVEALLVNRLDSTRDHYRAPIDECYRLVGIIRTHWRGLSGGRDVWKEIDRFFDAFNQRATKPPKRREPPQ